jgi:ABC-type glycerol-3-phosphate transport system permease component
MRRNVLAGLSHLALLIWAVLMLAPVAWTFLASFKTTEEIFGDAWSLPATPRLDNWARAFDTAHIGRYFLNSVLVVGPSTLGTMVLGAMAAYIFARYPFRGGRALYLIFASGMAFPVFLALTPLFFVVRNLGTLPVIGPYIGWTATAASSWSTSRIRCRSRSSSWPPSSAPCRRPSPRPRWWTGARTPGCSSASCCRWPGPDWSASPSST